MNAKIIYEKTKNKESTLAFVQEMGLIQTNTICSSCGGSMTLIACNTTSFPFRWRCSYPCRKEKSIRANTFFEKSKLLVDEILFFIYYWAYEECSFKKIKRELKWQSEAITNWKSYLREVCSLKLQDENEMLGGEGHVVQIDESLFVRRKYNVGRVPRQQWVFGGIDTTTKAVFLVCVEQRNADTLLPIIQERILPGTTIVSDLWAAYNTISHLGYDHLTVNHSINFVDPITFANTQRVENMWMRAKRRNKRECGTSSVLLESYLQEFMWREKYGDLFFENIINDIKTYYS